MVKNMNTQTPAMGICETYRGPGWVSYRVGCMCQHDDHALDAWVEVNSDRENPEIDVTFYVKTHTPMFTGFWDRTKTALRIMFRGENIQHHEIILDRQTALNFTTVLQKSIENLPRGNKRVQSN